MDSTAQNIPVWMHFLAPIVTLSAALIAATIAWISLRTNAGVNLRNKRMDIITHCNSRYDDLTKLRTEIESENPPPQVKIKSYFRRYWGLKSDQLDYWLAGYVDPETAASWFMSTAEAFSNESEIGGEQYFSYWKENIEDGHRVVNDRLVKLVDFIEESLSPIPDEAAQYAGLLQYLRILEGVESRLVAALSRNTHRRYRIRNFAETLSKDDLKRYDELTSYTCYIKFYSQAANWIKATYYSAINFVLLRNEANFVALADKLKPLHRGIELPMESYWRSDSTSGFPL